jgi:hypothetical protein
MTSPRRSISSLLLGGCTIAASLGLATYLSLPPGEAHASKPVVTQVKPQPQPAAEPKPTPVAVAEPAPDLLELPFKPPEKEKPVKPGKGKKGKKGKKASVDFGMEGY